jgi:hypothetical protein
MRQTDRLEGHLLFRREQDMSTGAIIALVVAVLVVAAIVIAATTYGSSGPGLKRRFGPEYERTLALHDGDGRAARRELTERVKRYGGLRPRPLSSEAHERYAARWQAVQARFVDDPVEALGTADALIAEAAVEAGYPAADSPEHMDALSVHHPRRIQAYRDTRAAPASQLDTEGRRRALVAARGLFEELTRTAGTAEAPGTEPGPEPEASADEEPAAKEPAHTRKPAVARRLAALTARTGRTEARR